MLGAGVRFGRGILELAMSVLIAFFLFRDGVRVANQFTSAIERIAGERAKHLIDVAGSTVRGVVHGILGTALAQGVLAGIGFAIAGVPGAGLLALLTFFLSVVPFGPPLVWIPAVIWLFHQDHTGWAIFMLCWGGIVSSVDNVIKPYLISHGSNLPFILILFGVLGGVAAFGFIGVFLGPTLLAVAFRLLQEWTATRALEVAQSAPPPAKPELEDIAPHD
jgi:predicted PurR-regulated permease PerM